MPTLQEIIAQLPEKKSFKYMGFTFVPAFIFRDMHVKNNLKDITKYLVSNNGINDWNYKEFYKVSTDSKKDIFLCLEDKKFYVPGNPTLFLFVHPELEEIRKSLWKEEPEQKKKNCYSAYITVRIDYESDEELTDEDVQDIVSELDYSFQSKTKSVEIIDTEICGINS